MGLYAITVTETRDAIIFVDAPTVEHARDTVRRNEVAEGVDWDLWEPGYNRWISKTERLDEYGTD